MAKFKYIDWMIVSILLVFMIISSFTIYSVTAGTIYDGMHLRHVQMFLAGFIILFLTAFLNYRWVVKHFAYILYGLALALLLLVPFIGVTEFNAQRWLEISGIQFQPSELMKLCFIMVVAHWLSKRKGDPLTWKDMAVIGAFLLPPFYLVFDQPDLGTSLVFIMIVVCMIWIGNVRVRYAVAGLLIVTTLISTIFFLYFNHYDVLEKLLSPHQLDRIDTFLNPENDPDENYHVVNAMDAIGSGELLGKGFNQGFYTQNGYVPVQYSDSIFVAIAEEFGFIGSSAVILLYFLLLYRMITICIRTQNDVGSYLVVGVVAMFVLQVFENIGMHMNLLPLTGIPLPFISWGRTSLLINMLAIGMVLSVGVHSRLQPEDDE